MVVRGHEAEISSDHKVAAGLFRRTLCDLKKSSLIALVKPAAALGDVGPDRDCGAAYLPCQPKALVGRKPSGELIGR